MVCLKTLLQKPLKPNKMNDTKQTLREVRLRLKEALDYLDRRMKEYE